MLRSNVALAVLGLGVISIAAVGGEKVEAPANVETITFTAVKTNSGSAIQMAVGDFVFVVPRASFVSKEGWSSDMVAEDGKLQMTTANELGRSVSFKAMTLNLRNPQSVRHSN